MFFIICGLFIALIFLINRYSFGYWSRRGVPQKDGTFIFGSISEMFTLKAALGVIFYNFYRKYKDHKIFGFYLSYRRALIINDPKLVQDVLVRDFNSFHDRGFAVNEEEDPLSGHLLSLPGKKWRDLRVKLTPVFTSGKLKIMFPIIRDCGKVLEDYLEKNIKNETNVMEFRDLLARLSTNMISTVAFGVENDAINDRENDFRKMGYKIVEPTPKVALKNMMRIFFPKLFEFLKLHAFNKFVEDFIFSLVRQTIEFREKNNFERNDLMQLLINLKNKGYVSADRDEIKNDKATPNESSLKKLTVDEIAAQAFIFFLGGFETSSTTMSYCLLELCKNQDIQAKVHNEIDRIIKTADINDLTYEMMNEMKYLDCCIDETLRKYPVGPHLFRIATKDYTFKDINVKIEKGTSIFIPVMGLQRDPNIFEDPLTFKPERFLDSSTGNGKGEGLFYIPFGDGPRICIGQRLGIIQMKVGLISVLSKFKVELADDSLKNEMTFDKTQHITLCPDRPFPFKVTQRRK